MKKVGLATDFSQAELEKEFGENFHVRHKRVLERQRPKLVQLRVERKSAAQESPVD